MNNDGAAAADPPVDFQPLSPERVASITKWLTVMPKPEELDRMGGSLETLAFSNPESITAAGIRIEKSRKEREKERREAESLEKQALQKKLLQRVVNVTTASSNTAAVGEPQKSAVEAAGIPSQSKETISQSPSPDYHSIGSMSTNSCASSSKMYQQPALQNSNPAGKRMSRMSETMTATEPSYLDRVQHVYRGHSAASAGTARKRITARELNSMSSRESSVMHLSRDSGIDRATPHAKPATGTDAHPAKDARPGKSFGSNLARDISGDVCANDHPAAASCGLSDDLDHASNDKVSFRNSANSLVADQPSHNPSERHSLSSTDMFLASNSSSDLAGPKRRSLLAVDLHKGHPVFSKLASESLHALPSPRVSTGEDGKSDLVPDVQSDASVDPAAAPAPTTNLSRDNDSSVEFLTTDAFAQKLRRASVENRLFRSENGSNESSLVYSKESIASSNGFEPSSKPKKVTAAMLNQVIRVRISQKEHSDVPHHLARQSISSEDAPGDSEVKIRLDDRADIPRPALNSSDPDRVYQSDEVILTKTPARNSVTGSSSNTAEIERRASHTSNLCNFQSRSQAASRSIIEASDTAGKQPGTFRPSFKTSGSIKSILRKSSSFPKPITELHQIQQPKMPTSSDSLLDIGARERAVKWDKTSVYVFEPPVDEDDDGTKSAASHKMKRRDLMRV
ncbi:hypothetical protein HDU83_005120 [Entophlyctis luteolus]|nr:hypothetical protein HDU83_005120 [Entophlyctis luteolus]